MNNQEIKKLGKSIIALIDEVKGKFREEGMTDKTIDIALEGGEIRECPECHTPNLILSFTCSDYLAWDCTNCGKAINEEKGK